MSTRSALGGGFRATTEELGMHCTVHAACRGRLEFKATETPKPATRCDVICDHQYRTETPGERLKRGDAGDGEAAAQLCCGASTQRAFGAPGIG
jgi:hypothetical protein